MVIYVKNHIFSIFWFYNMTIICVDFTHNAA